MPRSSLPIVSAGDMKETHCKLISKTKLTFPRIAEEAVICICSEVWVFIKWQVLFMKDRLEKLINEKEIGSPG